MARKSDFLGTARTLATSLTFGGNDIPASVPGASLVALHFALTGTIADADTAGDVTVNNLSRVRVKANGINIVDLTGLALRSYLETFNWSNTAPADSATETASGYSFTIPFGILDANTEDAQDICAFPLGATPTVELTFTTDTNIASQSILVGWTTSDIEPKMYPAIYGLAMNLTDSGANATVAVNQSYSFVESGFVRALGVNLAGLARFRAQLGSVQKVNLRGRTAPAATNTADCSPQCGSLFTEASAFRSPLTAGVSGGGAAMSSGYHWHKLVGMLQAPPGSRVELDLNNDWGGATNELGIYALRRQPQIG